MTRQVLGVTAYRFRGTFRGRKGGYVALAVMLGLLGGLAMASVAGARRTQSSFPAYLASTNPADLQMFTAYGGITRTTYSPEVESAIARLPYVRHAAEVIGFDPTSQVLDVVQGQAVPGQSPPALEGSPNGEYFSQDRLSVIRGRMSDPSREDEVVMSAGAAAESGLRLGSTLRVAFFGWAQEQSPTFSGYPQDHPQVLITLRLVGIIRNSGQIVQDDDAALGNQLAVLTPALTRRLITCCAGYTYVAVQLAGGARHVGAVSSAITKLAPDLQQLAGTETAAPLVAKAERVVRPEAVAFGVFGVVTALAALIIGGLLGSRLVHRNAHDTAVLRALGASPAMTMADTLVGIAGAVVAGSALAVAVAVALSPLAPIGPVRPVYPHPGFAADWAVLGFGSLLLVGVLGVFSLLLAYHDAAHRAARRAVAVQRSSFGLAATATGFPPTAVIGIRAAVGSGASRAAPVRSALLGAVLAVLVVVASITFGSSLHSLVSRPALYGWNWDYAMLSAFSGQEDLPAPQIAALLDRDPTVGQWSGINFVNVTLDGQRVPGIATTDGATVGPPLLSGHGLQAANQVVLGPSTLAALHKHVGDTVVAQTGTSSSTLLIVGTATLPTIGGGTSSMQMGSGAIASRTLFPAQALNQQGSSVPGPNAVLVRVRPGVKPAVARRSLEQDAIAINNANSETPAGGVVSVLRPAEIANYRAVGSTPAILASILAVGVLAALGLTLLASVRGRRREFAILKTLGFTRRQLAATVVWQASVAAVVGVMFGAPLGIALGRQLWTLFARAISAVPDPTVLGLSVATVAVGALVFANVVALFPAWFAARTPSAIVLRSE